MSRRILTVTGSRAEYGLLRPVMDYLKADDGVELQLAVTGAHLSPRFGLTYREIEADGFRIDAKVDLPLDSDTPAATANAMGRALSGFGHVLERLGPDLLLVLGDRYEILSAVAAALVSRIPVAHIHGGEVTEGAIDDAMRHSITKMSHLHFVAAEEYRQRVIQLGEAPERVFMVGGLGVDVIRRTDLLDRPVLEQALQFSFGERNLLVTFHPATLEPDSAASQMAEILAALQERPDTHVIFTMPNADSGNLGVFALIDQFVATHPNACAHASLGMQKYLSCVRAVDGVVGNSSSGLTEVPAFRKGTINIGDRQRGRLKANSVIDCAPDRASISAALERLYSPAFQAGLKSVRNPYGDGGAAAKIVAVLRNCTTRDILRKSFHDIPALPIPSPS